MRVALAGAGGRAGAFARALSDLGVLSAVWDAGSGMCEEECPVRHASVGGLLESGAFDAAVLAGDVPGAAETARALLCAKKHVFAESLMTLGSGEVQRLAKLAERNGLVLAYGQAGRPGPAAPSAAEAVRATGDPLVLEFHSGGPAPQAADAGVICGAAVYDIAAANWLFGGVPAVVFARAGEICDGHGDYASIMLGYGGDRIATITSSRGTADARRLSVTGTEASLSYDLAAEEEAAGGAANAGTAGHVAEEVRGFAGAAAGRGPRPDPVRAVHAARVAEAALLSSQKGFPIYLDLR